MLAKFFIDLNQYIFDYNDDDGSYKITDLNGNEEQNGNPITLPATITFRNNSINITKSGDSITVTVEKKGRWIDKPFTNTLNAINSLPKLQPFVLSSAPVNNLVSKITEKIRNGLNSTRKLFNKNDINKDDNIKNEILKNEIISIPAEFLATFTGMINKIVDFDKINKLKNLTSDRINTLLNNEDFFKNFLGKMTEIKDKMDNFKAMSSEIKIEAITADNIKEYISRATPEQLMRMKILLGTLNKESVMSKLEPILTNLFGKDIWVKMSILLEEIRKVDIETEVQNKAKEAIDLISTTAEGASTVAEGASTVVNTVGQGVGAVVNTVGQGVGAVGQGASAVGQGVGTVVGNNIIFNFLRTFFEIIIFILEAVGSIASAFGGKKRRTKKYRRKFTRKIKYHPNVK
jgi:hypothetical protein